jgi:hypothetical protein
MALLLTLALGLLLLQHVDDGTAHWAFWQMLIFLEQWNVCCAALHVQAQLSLDAVKLLQLFSRSGQKPMIFSRCNNITRQIQP